MRGARFTKWRPPSTPQHFQSAKERPQFLRRTRKAAPELSRSDPVWALFPVRYGRLGKCRSEFWKSDGSKPLIAHFLTVLKTSCLVTVASCGFVVCVRWLTAPPLSMWGMYSSCTQTTYWLPAALISQAIGQGLTFQHSEAPHPHLRGKKKK